MADVRMPGEMISWMEGLGWGPHHDRWHFERRWDFWHHLAEHGTPQQQAVAGPMVEYAHSRQWRRAEVQEGQPGNGREFLMMHRAMLHLILARFPEHAELVLGWPTPPTDPNAPEDPVPGGTPFEGDKAEGVRVVENDFELFADDDAYGIFLETNIRPLPGDPTNRDPDGRLGVHNYLHNRWTDPSSPINLGDPKVNLFNRRFWKLHGWIDRQWARYRLARGFSDEDPAYRRALEEHRHMMSGHHVHHTGMKADEGAEPAAARPAGFSHFFAF